MQLEFISGVFGGRLKGCCCESLHASCGPQMIKVDEAGPDENMLRPRFPLYISHIRRGARRGII